MSALGLITSRTQEKNDGALCYREDGDHAFFVLWAAQSALAISIGCMLLLKAKSTLGKRLSLTISSCDEPVKMQMTPVNPLLRSSAASCEPFLQ